eukprot:scaffold79081_cov66-Phaeocystis_antarctica.AAC.2
MTDGAAGASSMVTPNTLLITSRGFTCKATAADSTWLAPPAVSVATTVRITLPASTVMVSTHAGERHCSSWRKLALTESAFASYSSTVPPAFSTRVISLAGTITLTAPSCNGDGGGRGDIGVDSGSGDGDGGGGFGLGGGGDGNGGGGDGEGGGGDGDGGDGDGGEEEGDGGNGLGGEGLGGGNGEGCKGFGGGGDGDGGGGLGGGGNGVGGAMRSMQTPQVSRHRSRMSSP